MSTFRTLIMMILIVLFGNATTLADSLFVIETRFSNSRLALVDRTTGAVVSECSVQPSLIADALAYDLETDSLFTWEGGLIVIDRLTGQFHQINSSSIHFRGLAVHPTTFQLYGITLGGSLYTINKTNGSVTLVGNASIGFGHGLAFSPDARLYLSDTIGSGTSRLYELNLEDGSASLIAEIDRDFVISLDFGPDGLLYGSDNGTHTVIVIDPVTGHAQTIGEYGTGQSYPALAFTNDCRSDINGDTIVSVRDLLAVFAAWGCSECIEDVNDDGVVNELDLLELFANWGTCPVGC